MSFSQSYSTTFSYPSSKRRRTTKCSSNPSNDEIPINLLAFYAEKRKWKETVERAKSHPYETQIQNGLDGVTALHLACMHDPPLEVVTTLLNEFPHATSIQDLTGWTPIYYACRQASYEVVKMLLETNIDCIHSVRKGWNRSPLEQFCYEHGNRMVEAAHHMILQNNNPSCIIKEDHSFQRIWNVACMLVKASHHGTIETALPDSKIWRIVHACISMGNDCPSILLRLAMAIHPEQLQEATEEGILPLHLVIKTGREWDECFDTTLGLFPGAVIVRDERSGLFPFMLAAVEEKSSLASVYRILRACPEIERFAK